MKQSCFDNLPPLTELEALDILDTPVEQLNLSSDYYKAVFHLSKFPGRKTEDTLIALLESKSKGHSFDIAKRKAIEVLGNLRCNRAIPIIANYLNSEDQYTIDNAVWALQELKCHDKKIIRLIFSLLLKPKYNKRIVIQSLSRLGKLKDLTLIESFVSNDKLSQGEIGAAIAAINRFKPVKKHLRKLEKFLYSTNQNSRHCAIQDVIDSDALELLPSLLISPASPSLKFRALSMLWPESITSVNNLDVFTMIDQLVKDDPRKIKIINKVDKANSINYCLRQFFQTDFDRGYYALRRMIEFDPEEIWQYLSPILPELKKDYGALYYLIILFRIVPNWSDLRVDQIIDILYSSLDSNWPSYMRFRPVAISTLIHLRPLHCGSMISKWLDESHNQYWVCRYSVLCSLEPFINLIEFKGFKDKIKLAESDNNFFVRSKANKILQ